MAPPRRQEGAEPLSEPDPVGGEAGGEEEASSEESWDGPPRGTQHGPASGSRQVQEAARVSDSGEVIVRKLPGSVQEDLKWFVWNEVWRAHNSYYAEATTDRNIRKQKRADAAKDAKKRDKHLQAVKAAGVFHSTFLDEMTAEAEDAGHAAFLAVSEARSLNMLASEEYCQLPPPMGVSAKLWQSLVHAVHLAACATTEMMLETASGDELFQQFEHQWRQLGESARTVRADAAGAPSKRTGRLAQQTEGRRGGQAPGMQQPPLGKPEGPGASVGGTPLGGGPDLAKAYGSAFAQPAPQLGATASGEDSDGLDLLNAADLAVPCPDELKESSLATGLTNHKNLPAFVGCMGLWLDSADFAVGCHGKVTVGLGNAFGVGIHGSIRSFSGNCNDIPLLKKMLGKNGPCWSTTWRNTPRPSESTVSLLPSLPHLQSFANAMRVKKELGYPIVKGWAIYDLTSMRVGEGYLAERYWWNNKPGQGTEGWVDFTPRPEDASDLLLAESADVAPKRRPCALTEERRALAESLLCLRFPEEVVSRRRERGGPTGAISVALEKALAQAETGGDGAVRRAMASACRPGVALEQLSSEMKPVMQDVEELLEVLMQSGGAQEGALDELLEAGGVEIFVDLMTSEEDARVAATAASALACACCRNPKARARALDAGAPRALEAFHRRDDIRRMDCYAAEAAVALWQAESRALQQHALPVRAGRYDDAGQEHWQRQSELCGGRLADEHAACAPRERRARSWARALAFARAELGARGVPLRRGTADRPFVVWVLGAEDLVEGSLADEGFFEDANWVERAPTQVVLFGEGLRRLRPEHPPEEGLPAAVRTASYEEMPWLGHFGMPPPDIAAVLMPEVASPGAASQARTFPELALAAVAQVPAVVSTRYAPSEEGEMGLRRRLAKQLIMRHVRCPLSGNPGAPFDDNGWVFAVQGPGALARALSVEALPEVVQPYVPQQNMAKLPVVFWGILDIKYDTARPVLDRVKVLETGDGQTSKFSYDGADIKNRFEAKYQLDRSVDLEVQHVISADKKLTHDLVEQAGYGHVVPRQACFPREYQPDLARRIQEELGLAEGDKVVLKLCNRTRAAGVVVTPVRELDEVLEDLLQPPADLEVWFEGHRLRIMNVDASPVDLGLGTPFSFEEQRRHWWSNESPVFVAEVWCKSVPTFRDGQPFDGTMRVGFALRLRQAAPPGDPPDGIPECQQAALDSQPPGEALEVTPESLELDWLGGYWKLPKSGMDSSSGSLRESVVSMAKASGTAPVRASHLLEVFAALGDVVQRLYGRAEPSSAELAARYKAHPELAAFLTARLGTARIGKSPSFAKQMLNDADELLTHEEEGQGRSSARAFVQRARGVLELQHPGAVGGKTVEEYFQDALRLLRTNGNALHLLGLRALARGSADDAVAKLTKSLLLDPDYKGVYVHLGMAYLRLQNWQRAIDVSRAGQERHPDAPQFDYHLGVAYCQLALGLVDLYAAETNEMAVARAAAENFEARRAALQETERKAQEEMHAKKLAMEEAISAWQKADLAADAADKSAQNAPIEKGVMFTAKEAIAIFASLTCWDEIGALRKGQTITAAGPPSPIEGYKMLPIDRGAVDLSSLDMLLPPSDERVAATAKLQAKTAATAEWRDAVEKHRAAQRTVQECVPVRPTIPRRPASRILPSSVLPKYHSWRQSALEAFTRAREREQARSRRRGCQPPWLEVDDEMVDAMESAEGPVVIELPRLVGWPIPQYRM